MTWPTYPHDDHRPSSAGPSPLMRVGTGLTPGAADIGQVGLGGHFDDDTWETVLARRGWEKVTLGRVPAWASPPVAGLRILFACPHLDVTGLDSSRFYLGFRSDASDTDEVYAVQGGGDGEIIFDRLIHADAHFDAAAFVHWIDHGSMATIRRLH